MTRVEKRPTSVAHRSLAPIVDGVAASAVGTLTMDASLYQRYWHGGGTSAFPAWETSDGLVSWDKAPAPALVAKHFLERVLGHEVPARYARFLDNATHWAFGLATGAAYGLITGEHKPKVWYGLPFGAAVWAAGYVVLPELGVYKPIWKYDLKTLRNDLSAHLVFGTATAATFCLLDRGNDDRSTRA